MRRLIALTAILVTACRTGAESLDADYLKAQQWIRTEQFGLVLDRVDQWQSQARRAGNLSMQWRFRFLKAEALLGRENSAKEVLALLSDAGPLPPLGASDRTIWFILQARALYSLDRDKEVPGLLDQAASAASEARRPDLEAEIVLRRGFLLSDAGEFVAAHAEYQRALDASRQLHDRYLEARVEVSLGVLLQSESKHEEAMPELEHSRLIAREIGAADTAARAEGNLGYSYFRLGDYDNALSSFVNAETEFLKSGNLYEVQAWTGNAGNLYFEAGNFADAVRSYLRAVDIAHQVQAKVWEARWLSNLASISIEQKNWDEAEAYYKRARELKDKVEDAENEANSFNNAALIALGRGHLDDASVLFHKALERDAEDPTVSLAARTGLADVYSRRGRLKDAESEFRGTIAEIDLRQSKLTKDDHRLSWLGSLVLFYQKYVDFLIAQHQPDKALEAAESSRAKVLTSQPIRPLTAAGYRELSRRTGTVLLEYWLGPDHSYLWVVTPNKIFCHTLPSKTELLPLIRSYRAVITAGRNPLEVAGDTGLRLYNALLAPAMRDAGSAARFIIVPDDELHSLNFETLPDGDNSHSFWIDRATIRIAPSLDYLAANPRRNAPAGTPRLLLIGDPEPALPQYPHLEFARQEIRTVAASMSAAQPVIVQGAEATPASYANHQPGNFRFIHFSAHASAAARRESALDSAVILSGPPDKCRLVARDVLSIPLNAELVTVSACRSAGGKTYGGEGLVGFAWAFMKAGAGNVIAGLWDVNDRSTLLLMNGLYTQIAKGASIPEALRAAKLALIHGGGSYAKPFYWAPFQIYTARIDR